MDRSDVTFASQGGTCRAWHFERSVADQLEFLRRHLS